MRQEIERKFLVDPRLWHPPEHGIYYRQGYLQRSRERTVRVRIAGEKAWLTIKGKTEGIACLEFEYPIPPADAAMILSDLGDRPQIEKIRYRLPMDGFCWDVDEFLGVNQGLLLAEIELEYVEQSFPKPPWLGLEVSHEPRYYNSNLVTYPYRQWSPMEQQPISS